MSYTVLAVKWRPRRFEDLVGQEHVVRALVNGLAAERLHHAYLFTGTRGVGKTTVARILAKALNCEAGVVSEPCGECSACTAIDEGRFVDLIEVDAASRTKVDDTRELLDNVQYAPSRGRYKVYLIDEVHMLSTHSFNALLKTLEEPPPHVKFLLATTDPQKLPVTVLSRCLQFNLKRLSLAQIQAQLDKICAAEGINAEADGLKALARAADGSMRDALSMLDQGVAFGGGEVRAELINSMLGTIDRGHVQRLLEALANEDGAALLDEVERLDERAPDYGAVLEELMGALQQMAVIQLVGDRLPDEELELLKPLAERISPEDVQLYYQIALQGRRDLPVGRDPRVALEMTLLRMLAFRPVEDEGGAAPAGAGSDGGARPAASAPAAVSAAGQSASGARSPGARARSAPGAGDAPSGESAGASPRGAAAVRARLARETGGAAKGGKKPSHRNGAGAARPEPAAAQEPPAPPSASDAPPQPTDFAAPPAAGPDDLDDAPPAPPPPGLEDAHEQAPAAPAPGDGAAEWDGEWSSLIEAADIRGAARQLADHCELGRATDRRLELILDEDKATLHTEQLRSRLQTAISQYLGRQVTLAITAGQPPRPTPAAVRIANENERMRRAREAMEQDPNVKAVQQAFGAVLEADTIQPKDP